MTIPPDSAGVQPPKPSQFESPTGSCDVQNVDWLVGEWKRILKLDDSRIDQNLFYLGGDSLESMELLFRVEERYQCQLSPEEFFEDPTLSNLIDLVRKAAAAPTRGTYKSGANGLLHKLQALSGGWHGERQFADSMLVGLNTQGSRPPIFWVCQTFREAWEFAKHLGTDQPLYAMRSYYGIIRWPDLSPEVIETVCNRYLSEILALPLDSEFLVGGYCQGGILALELARQLNQIHRQPRLLVLLEWNFPFGGYAGPTLFIYGKDSHRSNVSNEGEANRQDGFTSSSVRLIPGGHKTFRNERSVARLARLVLEQNVEKASLRPPQSDAQLLSTNLTRRQMETRHLLAALMQREAEIEGLRSEFKKLAKRVKSVQSSTSWRITEPVRAVTQRVLRLRSRSKLRD